MYRKKRKVRAAPHRGSRKHYSIPVKKEVHDALHMVARVTGDAPGTVIERLLKR